MIIYEHLLESCQTIYFIVIYDHNDEELSQLWFFPQESAFDWKWCLCVSGNGKLRDEKKGSILGVLIGVSQKYNPTRKT